MKIRLATDLDIIQLLPFLEQLGYPTSIDNFTRRFKKFIKLDGYGIAVASSDNKIVGFVAWSKSSLIVSDATRFHIESIAVDPNFQKLGIGKKLMKFLEEHAANYAPAIIDLTSGLRRAKDGVHEFYKNLGYANEGYMAKLYLRKEIVTRSDSYNSPVNSTV